MMLAKLAFGNMRKLVHDYAVYFLTLVMGVAVFYAFNTISVQADFLSNTMSELLKQVGQILQGVTVFLAVIMGFLMVYANNFLMRRRKKELGLYQVLGMRAGQVNAILTLETLMVALASFVVGIALGALVSQLLLFVTADMFATKVTHFRFFFSTEALALTFGCFALTFLVMMVLNSISLSRVRLVDLMSSGRRNERQFVRHLPLSLALTVVGLLLMGYAYWRLTTQGFPLGGDPKNGATTTNDFLLTTAIVVAGTFVFFYGFAGALTLVLARLKGFYWRGLHMFTTRQIASRVNTAAVSMGMISLILFFAMTSMTSGMSICSTLNKAYEKGTPFDASVFVTGTSHKGSTIDFEGAARRAGVDLSSVGRTCTIRTAIVSNKRGILTIDTLHDMASLTGKPIPTGFENSVAYQAISVSDYNAHRRFLGLRPVTLEDGHYLYLCNMDQLTGFVDSALAKGYSIDAAGQRLAPARATAISDASCVLLNDSVGSTPGIYVVPDAVAAKLPNYTWSLNVRYKVSTEKGDDAVKRVRDQLASEDDTLYVASNTKTESAVEGTTTTGLISYMAIYIGFVLVIACAAILAIQQLSSASDTSAGYRTLSELGCPERTIFESLRAQVTFAFALPLVVGLAHSICATAAVNKVLQAFGHASILENVGVGLVIFALVYGGYLALTYRMAHGVVRGAIRSARHAL
ncbi:MAG: ABC transporter permease [Parafannyhessea sp.]|uniref:ABC transporter permease n=1 Tax=Parafannyhessea sp. TaxID=2847324 RepID=UPI003EFE3748